jgi:hypothetical protein
MENEVLGIINILKEANEFIFPAALHAAKIEAYMFVFFGLGVIIAVWLCIGIFYTCLSEEGLEVPVIIGGIFFSVLAFLFIVTGIYELNTLEYQAFKMILHGA